MGIASLPPCPYPRLLLILVVEISDDVGHARSVGGREDPESGRIRKATLLAVR